ncbi:MAG: phosphoenolpyruvate--protein phosphotransferase [Gemmatimonadota bacterium]|nr:MAG: phosphoenolpyruvate--protein phosphotransferase [Gemmatimonadota bacterium]
MSLVGVMVQGIPAAPGIVIGPAFVARWPRLEVPHATVGPDEIEAEVARFQAARQLAKERTSGLREQVESRLGSVQAKIFDPQLMMLEDPDLIEGTLTYICDSFLTAERAFSLRVLEFRSRWLDATHARVMDRVADLLDVQLRVLETLIDIPGPEFAVDVDDPVILVAHELTPSRMVDLDRSRVLGVATDAGTRTSHAAILARSIGLPCVVGLGDLSYRVENGVEIILDGRRGKVLIAPSESEKRWFHDRDARAKQAEKQLEGTIGEEARTRDGERIGLYANLELPADARAAVAVNADGVGLFRTEFLVVGKTAVPAEEEQYEAFKSVVDTLAPRPVTIRTFDLGGDKFPMFLPPIAEENPFLGWRGIRIYEMMPELFRYQVRAALRAAAHGQVRLLVPMVNTVDEVQRIRAVIDEARRELERDGIEHAVCPLGVMLETPASVAIAAVLGRYVDFFSLGTNDLIQYMLAVDRGNAQLSRFFDLYHPALLMYIRDAVAAASATGVPLCVCGEAASDPLGSLLLLGLGVRSLSCTPSAILGQKRLIRSIDLGQVERVVSGLLDAETGREIREQMVMKLGDVVDLAAVDADNNLSPSD